MSWRTSKVGVMARNVGRRLGVNRLIAKSNLVSGAERDPDASFIDLIDEGDCVWDVGANLGTYTVAFADKAGAEGQVLAFEPSRANRARLTERVADRTNVSVHGQALAAQNGTVRFIEDELPAGTTSRIDYGQSGAGYDVPTVRADALVAEQGLPAPKVIKIDVEGAEWDVIEGMGAVLSDPGLRVVYVEVHFSILQNRGRTEDARRIETALRDNTFVVRWVDASHIIAARSKAA